MSDLIINLPEGATPLDPDETLGLIPEHIIIQKELNEWEYSNIQSAELWLTTQSLKTEKILSEDFCRKLHKKMFGETWKWAGKFRQSNKNIGVDKSQVSIELKKLLDDVTFYISNKTFDFDEIAARFHHRLVYIHLFPNGNGRHARLMTDILLKSLKQKRFSWGSTSLYNSDKAREAYIHALRNADKHDYQSLLEFVRS